MTPLREQSLLKEDVVKLYRDDTMNLLRVLEAREENRIFFDYAHQWAGFLRELRTAPKAEAEARFRAKLKRVIDSFKEIDLKIEEMRGSLRKSFFNSIMTTREFIRNSGFIQLKVQNKAQTKRALIEKLMSGLRDDLKIFRVLKEFKQTYSKSKREIERRAKFDYLMVSYLRTMMMLIKEENQLRKRYLKENSTLLPQTFCPFLTNYLSEQIIKQLEVYFMNDTSIDELEDEQIARLHESQRGLDQEDMVFRLRDFLEQYMACAESLSPIHHNLSLVLQAEANSYRLTVPSGSGMVKERGGSQHTGLKTFCLKIKEADFNLVDPTNSFVKIDSHGRKSRDRYLSFTAEVESTLEGMPGAVNCPTFVIGAFRQVQSPSENTSFAVVN